MGGGLVHKTSHNPHTRSGGPRHVVNLVVREFVPRGPSDVVALCLRTYTTLSTGREDFGRIPFCPCWDVDQLYSNYTAGSGLTLLYTLVPTLAGRGTAQLFSLSW